MNCFLQKRTLFYTAHTQLSWLLNTIINNGHYTLKMNTLNTPPYYCEYDED